MRRTWMGLAAAAALVAAPVRAHEQGGRAMGVIESVTPERIVVRTSDGHDVTFVVTKETRFVRGAKAVRVEDVRAGERAVVQGERDGEALEAVQVKLGAKAARK